MVFGENIDKLLWMMISGEQENMDKLAYFIRIIPEDVYEQVRYHINKYNENSNGKDNGCKIKMRTNNDGYMYELEFEIGEYLCLKLWRWKGITIEERFQLVLSNKTIDIINNMKNFDKIHIGSFSCNVINGDIINIDFCSKIINANNQYYLIKTPVGYLVKSSSMFDENMKLVNYRDKCPDELQVHDFSSLEKVEHLVRVRKRNGFGLINPK